MPITFDINRSKNLTIFSIDGDTNEKEIISTVKSYCDAGPTDNALYDFSKGSWKNISFEKISSLVKIGKSYTSRANWKIAIIPSGDLGFQMGRIYQGMTNVEDTPQQAIVFRSVDEAYQWFNIPSETP